MSGGLNYLTTDDINEPLLLTPVFKDYIWGGFALRRDWGKDPNGNKKIAESWELSCLPGNETYVANEKYHGKTLIDLSREYNGIFGTRASKFKNFPALIKIIDANNDLSIQVHPNDKQALEIENYSMGKTEVWYVADAKPDAHIYLGFKKTNDESILRQAISNNTFCDFLNKIPVKAGDFFSIPAGTVHALLSGALIVEIQETSNITYRLYDYDRKNEQGEGRELHIEKAFKVMNKARYSIEKQKAPACILSDGSKKRVLIKTEYFDVNEIVIKNKHKLYNSNEATVLTILSGDGKFTSGAQIKKGDTYFIRPKLPIQIEGDLSMIETLV
ncbi:MAG: mannose-6-phosphate isomerase [Christensenellaceae bacterium]|jgi:mannose-6-phosphate isomerase|nr:mannose-6-phosphate isomerase [Christensenellaceae bacterium]